MQMTSVSGSLFNNHFHLHAALPKQLVLDHFFFPEMSTGVNVRHVKNFSGWDPPDYPGKMGYHELADWGDSEWFDGIPALPDIDPWPESLPHHSDGTVIQ